MSAASMALAAPARIGGWAAASLLKALHAALSAPEYVFLVALMAMLFRPSDLRNFPMDRLAFLVLAAVFLLRLLLWREKFAFSTASWPMLLLLSLGLRGVLGQPYNATAWSVLAAQWIVPVALFHMARSVFAGEEQQRKLEWFSLAILVYLSLVAVFWLCNVHSLIFPRFILDDTLGIHADRARGPLLQAVANGVSINLLGIAALHAYDRGSANLAGRSGLRRRSIAAVLFVATPLALLATKTRAVWLAAAVSAALIILFARGRRSRTLVTVLALLVVAIASCLLLLRTGSAELEDRLQDRSPAEFRLAMYRAGWQMFTEKPLFGWGSDANIQTEVERHVSSFHPDSYNFHNTYLQLAIQHGLLGLLLYAWLILAFFRLGEARDAHATVFGSNFALMWRVMLCVYLLNASVVVMNYQFVNGYMFTVAGILAARQGLARAVERVWRPA